MIHDSVDDGDYKNLTWEQLKTCLETESDKKESNIDQQKELKSEINTLVNSLEYNYNMESKEGEGESDASDSEGLFGSDELSTTGEETQEEIDRLNVVQNREEPVILDAKTKKRIKKLKSQVKDFTKIHGGSPYDSDDFEVEGEEDDFDSDDDKDTRKIKRQVARKAQLREDALASKEKQKEYDILLKERAKDSNKDDIDDKDSRIAQPLPMDPENNPKIGWTPENIEKMMESESTRLKIDEIQRYKEYQGMVIDELFLREELKKSWITNSKDADIKTMVKIIEEDGDDVSKCLLFTSPGIQTLLQPEQCQNFKDYQEVNTNGFNMLLCRVDYPAIHIQKRVVNQDTEDQDEIEIIDCICVTCPNSNNILQLQVMYFINNKCHQLTKDVWNSRR